VEKGDCVLRRRKQTAAVYINQRLKQCEERRVRLLEQLCIRKQHTQTGRQRVSATVIRTSDCCGMANIRDAIK
jgi:hypothetical protein